MRVGGLQQAFNSEGGETPALFPRTGGAALAPCTDRISPDQGCLEIAVMLEESTRFWRAAATARRSALAIVFFDRCAALIRVFTIGAYKPV
jgi:hypothetical protein